MQILSDGLLPSKLQGNSVWVPCSCRLEGDRLSISFRYNKSLLTEIKAFDGARWDPDRRLWTIKDNERNRFQLAYLAGQNPYAHFDKPLIENPSFTRPLREHQIAMYRSCVTYHYHILAAEMGTGKTLVAIEVMDNSGFPDWWYVAPKSALAAVSLELRKWDAKVRPLLYTYDALKRILENWPEGTKPPQGVFFDESSRVKTPTAQRSLAAYHLSKAIRAEYGWDGYVIEMSGSPAPKSPADWYMQCEIAMPGFIREGTYEKFKNRLGLIVQKESITGGTYPHLVTWLDDTSKCAKCGKFADDPAHDALQSVFAVNALDIHPFENSKNEVAYLYERMKGLVSVFFKKDCLDLPDKQYRTIKLKPNQSTINAARLITKAAATTIQGLTLLRELSDGFQYEEEKIGTKDCENCQGVGTIIRPMPTLDSDGNQTENFEDQEIGCPNCGGSGQVPIMQRKAIQVPCPKEDALREILDAHDEDGRLVAYAGFTGSVDRCVQIAQKEKWDWIRVDGRGWASSLPYKKPEDMLLAFQDSNKAVARLIFIGQPAAAGMGLTLTASCEIVYYSNDFNAESRIQSEDRIHRTGMDLNKGALITDLIHLPSDDLVLQNLQKKRKLQDLSLGQFHDALKNSEQHEGVRQY